MLVRDLRKALEGAPDDLDVLVHAVGEDDEGDETTVFCGAFSAAVQPSCHEEDPDAFVIQAADYEDAVAPPEAVGHSRHLRLVPPEEEVE